MAHDNETNTVELHIKAISSECKIGTLRLPSDPSWPKIPLRRLTNDTDNIIKPPCVVTLIKTSGKNHSVIQSIMCQHSKSKLNQRYESSTCKTKRFSGYIDPRFKRQTLQHKVVEKPNKSSNLKSHENFIIQKIITKQAKLELNTSILQESKKYENNLENIKSLEAIKKSTVKTINYPIKQYTSEANYCTKAILSQPMSMTDKPYNLECRFFRENKQAQKCSNVENPIITYHNISLQVPTQIQENIKILYESENDYIKHKENIRNIYIQQCDIKNDLLKIKDISCCNNENINCICNKQDINLNASSNTLKKILLDKNYSEDPDKMDKADNKKNFKNSLDFNTIEKLETTVRQECNDIKRIMLQCRLHSIMHINDASNLNLKSKDSYILCKNSNVDKCSGKQERSSKKIMKSLMHFHIDMQKQRLINRSWDKRDYTSESSTRLIGCNKTNKINLRYKRYNKNNKDKTRNRKMCNSLKHQKVSINLSKKVKSFFRKKSCLAIIDSDCTLILPGSYRIIKAKQCKKTSNRLKRVSQLFTRRDKINSMSYIRTKSIIHYPKQNQMSQSRSLTNIRVENSFEKPSSTPLETWKLLKKSYIEYYRKIRYNIALAKSETAVNRNKYSVCNSLQDCLSGSQTLQQCSLLSCMINNTLDTVFQDSAVIEGRSFLTTNETLNEYKNADKTFALSTVSVKKTKLKKSKQAAKQPLGLRTIALLGITLHVAVIFLPMIYDYLFNEEYEDYENINYITLILEYIALSFANAFYEIVNVFHVVFLHLAKFNQKF